nr:Chain C, structural protein VP3 [Sacbrood virus]
DEPRTTLDIARIWGLRSTFNWGSGDEHGKELFNTVLDPGLRFYDQDYEGQITPMEYVTGLYNFWSGPIELRFDFVSNAFHTGTVIISAEYNRSSTNTDECQSHSTYTKTFHLGEQKSVHFTVPYIYDTVVRRNTASAYLPVTDYDKVDNVSRAQAMGIRAESKMRVKVRVVNVLRPVASTTSTIEVLVYMRGGKNYALHGLKQSTYWPSNSVVPIDSFPPDGYDP